MSVKGNQISVGTDQNDVPTYGIDFVEAIFKFQISLVTPNEATLVVPGGCQIAIFEFTPSGVWVANSTTPIAVPGGVFASTEAELNPGVRNVKPGDTLRFISTANVEIGVQFYKVDRTFNG